MGWQASLLMFTLHLDSGDGAGTGCYGWPAASASPRPLAHTSLRNTGTQKSCSLKEQLGYKSYSPWTLPNSGRAAQVFSGLEVPVSTTVYISSSTMIAQTGPGLLAASVSPRPLVRISHWGWHRLEAKAALAWQRSRHTWSTLTTAPAILPRPPNILGMHHFCCI